MATTNPHQPVVSENKLRLTCAAEGCREIEILPDVSKFIVREGLPRASQDDVVHNYKLIWEREHTTQFDPGRAPNITIDYTISASCSVCEDGIGDIVSNDGDSVRCQECGTTWDMEGEMGERVVDETEEHLEDGAGSGV